MSSTISSSQRSSTSRLSSRRGSLSAPDPFAQNQKVEPPRGQTSRLTVICIPSSGGSSTSPGPSEQDAESRTRKRSLSPAPEILASRGDARASPENANYHRKRMSFARSSFSSDIPSASDPGSSRSPSSISSSPATHHTRSTLSRPASSFHPRQSSLSPQQICKLAHSSLKMATSERASSVSPQPSKRSSPLFCSSGDSNQSECSSQEPSDITPASFNPLPEFHYLPFFDRPSEVSALLSSEENSRCLFLLKHTFPPQLRDSSENNDSSDPTEWSFRRLVSYLTESSRSDSSDKVWVRNIGHCLRARSEVIWERFKNILGVPPELDVEDPIDNEESHGELEEEGPEEVEERGERLYVEPIYPASSLSPQMSVSEMEDDDSSHVGHRNSMENIGEGEEYDGDNGENVAIVTNARSESLDLEDRSEAGSPAGNICALRLHAPMSPPPELIPSLELRPSPTTRKAYSFSEGNGHRAVSPFTVDDPRRSVSVSYGRRSSDMPLDFEHGFGNPLFPSNFGCLSIAPTFPANNPIHISLTPTYNLNRRVSSGSDYALTLASGSDRSPVAYGPELPYS